MSAVVAHPAARSVLPARLAALIPALMLAYPVLIAPLIYVDPVDYHTGLRQVSAEAESRLLNRIYYPPLLLLAIACFLGSERRGARAVMPVVMALLVFGAVCAASVAWALVPELAIRRVILQTFIVASVVLAVMAVDDADEVLEPIFWLMVVAVLFNLHAVAVYPPTRLGHAGIYGQKNLLGAFAAQAGFIALWRLGKPGHLARVVAFGTLAASVVLLLASMSKTSLGFFLLAPLLGLILCGMVRLFRVSAAVPFIGFVTATGFGYAFATTYLLLDFGDVMGILTGDPTLTERTTIWRFAGETIERAPWLGYGYGSFWQVGTGVPSFNEAPGFVATMPHAHNGYIDIVLQLGVLGLALFIPIVLLGIHLAGRVVFHEWRLSWYLMTLTLFIVLHNLLETTWFNFINELSMLFTAAICIAARAAERE